MSTKFKTYRSIKIESIIAFVTLLAFMFPRGFDEYLPTYSIVHKTLLALSVSYVLASNFANLISSSKIEGKMNFCLMIIYHFVLLLITLLIQHGVNEGVQKIFFTPAFFWLCSNQINKDYRKFLSIFSDILIVILFLNITLFNEHIFPQYFAIDRHITFLGHVQVIAQIGLLAITVGVINYPIDSRKSRILIIISIINMIYSMTAVSFISIGGLLIGVLMTKKFSIWKNISAKTIYIATLLMNMSVLIAMPNLQNKFSAYHIDLSMSGRTYVWEVIIYTMKGHWILGYGAYGVLFKMFWNLWSGNKAGSNYAHNEILQLTLDGGIVLLIVYIVFVFSCASSLNKCKNIEGKRICIVIMGVFGLISIVESVTEYYYYFAFLAIVSNFKRISYDLSYQQRCLYCEVK